MAFRIPEMKPEIAFHTVEITLEMVSITVLTVVEIAFQIVSKNVLMPSRTIVTTALIVSHVVVIDQFRECWCDPDTLFVFHTFDTLKQRFFDDER